MDVSDRVITVWLVGLAEFMETDAREYHADLVEVETIEGRTSSFSVDRGADLAEDAISGRLEDLGGHRREAHNFVRDSRTSSLLLL